MAVIEHEIVVVAPESYGRIQGDCSCGGWKSENRGAPPTSSEGKTLADSNFLESFNAHVEEVREKGSQSWAVRQRATRSRQLRSRLRFQIQYAGTGR